MIICDPIKLIDGTQKSTLTAELQCSFPHLKLMIQNSLRDKNVGLFSGPRGPFTVTHMLKFYD